MATIKQQTPTIRLNLSEEEYRAFRIHLAIEKLTASEVLSMYVRRLLKHKKLNPSLGVDDSSEPIE